MIPILLLQLMAAPASAPAQAPIPAPTLAPTPVQEYSFFSGRFQCQLVDESTKVSPLAFDYRGGAIAVVDGGPFARAGSAAKARSAISKVGPVQVRQTNFEDDSSGLQRSYELVEMVGTGYRASRLAVFTQSGGLRGAGKGLVMAVSQLTAVGMCKAAPQQDRR